MRGTVCLARHERRMTGGDAINVDNGLLRLLNIISSSIHVNITKIKLNLYGDLSSFFIFFLRTLLIFLEQLNIKEERIGEESVNIKKREKNTTFLLTLF